MYQWVDLKVMMMVLMEMRVMMVEQIVEQLDLVNTICLLRLCKQFKP